MAFRRHAVGAACLCNAAAEERRVVRLANDDLRLRPLFLQDARNALECGELFFLKYHAKLPQDLGCLYVGGFGAHYDVSLKHRSRDDRNKALAHLGEVFGRSGWEAKMSTGYQFHGFDWKKEVDGVWVKIEGAQPPA